MPSPSTPAAFDQQGGQCPDGEDKQTDIARSCGFHHRLLERGLSGFVLIILGAGHGATISTKIHSRRCGRTRRPMPAGFRQQAERERARCAAPARRLDPEKPNSAVRQWGTAAAELSSETHDAGLLNRQGWAHEDRALVRR